MTENGQVLANYLDDHSEVQVESHDYQKERIKDFLQQQIDNNNRVLLVSSDLYSPQPAAVVTLSKVYDNFATGYVFNKYSGVKIPYTINYYSLIAGDYQVESAWEKELKKS